jgi:hypothetical protein
MFEEFREKLKAIMFQVTFIQAKFRNTMRTMTLRTMALRHTILQKQTFLLVNQMVKQRKQESIIFQIQNLSEPKKDLICDIFIFLAKVDFRKSFL